MKPYFELSKQIAIEQYEKVKAFCDIVSYSSKTNQEVTRVLEQSEESKECMFSVHFENELKHVEDCSRVLFLAQAWNHEQINQLYAKGVRWFVVDNIFDLEVFLAYVREHDVNVNLLLRMKLKENTIRTEKYFVFGMASDVISEKIKAIRSESGLSEKIGELGVHFHRKTQNMSEWNLKYELSELFGNDVLQLVSVINIGGGLPSEYANTNVNVLKSIFRKIGEFREWLEENQIKLIIEPGRFIAAPAVKLVTQIIGVHDTTLVVNASVYNSDMDAIIVPVKLLVEEEVSREEKQNREDIRGYVIKGVTPCSLDLFRYRVYLPEKKVGDSVVFLNAGAYNFTTDFCDLDKIETKVVE